MVHVKFCVRDIAIRREASKAPWTFSQVYYTGHTALLPKSTLFHPSSSMSPCHGV